DVVNRQRQIDASYAEAAKRIDQLDVLQKSKRDLLRKAQVTATLIEPVPRSNLLAELINRMPASLSLLEFELDSKKVIAPAPGTPGSTSGSALSAAANAAAAKSGKKSADDGSIITIPRYEVKMHLIGVAPTDIQVAQYLASLSRCPLLSDANLVYSEETRIDDLSMRKFRIDLTLDPDADVRTVQPLRVDRALPAAPVAEASVPVNKD
ncbi:MAG: hypothetical protein WC058_15725, partial [Phycisphaeraceae bacterium]